MLPYYPWEVIDEAISKAYVVRIPEYKLILILTVCKIDTRISK